WVSAPGPSVIRPPAARKAGCGTAMSAPAHHPHPCPARRQPKRQRRARLPVGPHHPRARAATTPVAALPPLRRKEGAVELPAVALATRLLPPSPAPSTTPSPESTKPSAAR